MDVLDGAAEKLTRAVQDKGTTAPATHVDFGEMPTDALNKYLIVNGLVPQYPPAALYQEPRTLGVSDEAADTDPVAQEAQAEIERDHHDMMRTRSSQPEQRRRTAAAYRKDERDMLFYDVPDAHRNLGAIATEHYAAMPQPKESDLIVGFLYRCRARGTSMTSTGFCLPADSCLKIV